MVLGFISYQKAKRGNGSRAPGVGGMIVGALSAAVVTLAVLSSVAASLSAYSPSGSSPQPTGTEQPDDPALSGEEVPIGTMQVGQCALEVDPSVAVVTLLDCAEWHQAEVFGEVSLGEGEYPGDDAVASAASEQCTAAGENIAIPADVGTSALRVSTLTPDQAGWEHGTTSALCVLLHIEGRNMSGYVGTDSFTVR
ncbi:hypothetical protein GCM10023169_09790 [Georgenia halophila]|uniref:Septum formation-related domain-containing protein n=2 Tax=Georgenia halophila TaxID=620889 RepID=A0ABP8KZM0_9MICO